MSNHDLFAESNRFLVITNQIKVSSITTSLKNSFTKLQFKEHPEKIAVWVSFFIVFVFETRYFSVLYLSSFFIETRQRSNLKQILKNTQ